MAKGEKRDFREETARVEAEQGERIRPILEEIEKQRTRSEQEGLNFTGATESELRKKLSSRNSPFIVTQSWLNSAAPGGTIPYTAGIWNPDPFTVTALFVHVFVGPANMVPDAGHALATVDTRFPRLTQPSLFGLSIPSQRAASLSFNLAVPSAGLQPSTYFGNAFLFAAEFHDVGFYFDRGLFPFTVT